MSDQSSIVFVYGTLREGDINYHYLKNSVKLFNQARVRGTLYDTGNGYPAYIEKGEKWVYGELYAVSLWTLKQLDRLEGYSEGQPDNLYNRVKLPIETDIGIIEAWVYTLDDQHETALTSKIGFQDWRVHQWFNNFTEVKYFAYGSCMDTERIEKAGMLTPFSQRVETGKLTGYSMCYTLQRDDGSRADIVETEDTSSSVEGIIYTLPKEAIDYLFCREGVFTGSYRATFVKVEINGVFHQDVLTFTVINKQAETCPPRHYGEEILRGAKGRLSNNYYEQLLTKLTSLGYNHIDGDH
ncbi:gamma-glutamylcyclotransferase [Bacillus sp. A301a_S52]|nr:gamma-glutamylcyclotransferase [Bacillus sp. A301a_S52]